MKKPVKKMSAPRKAAPAPAKPEVNALKAPPPAPLFSLKIIDETTSCADCGATFTEENTSVLRSGMKFHVRCPKKGAAMKKILEAKKHKSWCGVNGPTRQCNCAGRSAPPPPKKIKPEPEPDLGDMAVYVDDNSHVHLILHIGQKIAVYTKIDPGGMTTYERRLDQLARELRPLKTADGHDYPVLKVCERFARAAVKYGATQGVLDHLARVVKLTPEEVEMAKNKKGGSTASAGKKGGEKRDSAAAMFKDLILEGKLTDDQIFAKVKAKFDLDDNKRGYVSWYRNNLRKQGKKVPDPIGGEKKAKAKAAPANKAKGKPAAKAKAKPSKKPAPKREKAAPVDEAPAPAESAPAA